MSNEQATLSAEDLIQALGQARLNEITAATTIRGLAARVQELELQVAQLTAEPVAGTPVADCET